MVHNSRLPGSLKVGLPNKYRRFLAVDVVVRRFREADADKVVEMMRGLASYHGDQLRVGPEEFIAYASGANPIALIWILELVGELVGFAASYDWMNFVKGYPVRHIDLMYTAEHVRSSGMGSILMAGIVADAEAAGCQRVSVTAAFDNAGANNFYRKLGFEPRELHSQSYIISGDAMTKLAALR